MSCLCWRSWQRHHVLQQQHLEATSRQSPCRCLATSLSQASRLQATLNGEATWQGIWEHPIPTHTVVSASAAPVVVELKLPAPVAATTTTPHQHALPPTLPGPTHCRGCRLGQLAPLPPHILHPRLTHIYTSIACLPPGQLTIVDVVQAARVDNLLTSDSGAGHAAHTQAELCHGAVELGTTIQSHVAVGQVLGRHQGLALTSSEGACRVDKRNTRIHTTASVQLAVVITVLMQGPRVWVPQLLRLQDRCCWRPRAVR